MEYPNVETQPYRRCWTKPVNQYASHYNNIDVLLVPLVENKFNEVKSQLKVVEAGFFNKTIIAQDFGPYKIDLKSYIQKGGTVDETGNSLLVESSKNHKQWAKHIKYLLNHPEERIKMANNLSEKITKEYSLENVTKARVELYKKITSK
jgi:glycosyltransferase involved in cell wall biosynthesis